MTTDNPDDWPAVSLTARQAYLAMFRFLEQYHDATRADDVGALLGGLQLLADGGPADFGYRDEWVAAARAVLDERGGTDAATRLSGSSSSPAPWAPAGVPRTPAEERITVSLAPADALVLYEWLASADEIPDPRRPGRAEQSVLRKVEGQLESALPEVVAGNYAERVADARRVVLGGESPDESDE